MEYTAVQKFCVIGEAVDVAGWLGASGRDRAAGTPAQRYESRRTYQERAA